MPCNRHGAPTAADFDSAKHQNDIRLYYLLSVFADDRTRTRQHASLAFSSESLGFPDLAPCHEALL